MPDPVDKKELGGLARSIDSLFSAQRQAYPEEDGGDRADTGAFASPPTPRVATPEPDPFAVVEPTGPGRATEPRDARPPALAEGPPPLPAEEPAPLPVEPPDAEADAPDAAPPPPAELVEAESEPPGAAPAAAGTDGELEPAPLEVAVAAFLAGGRDDDRIRAHCETHAAAGEYDAVAAAVERLVLGAGSPPDPEIVDLARALMSPIVRARIVLRMGQERDEARRGAYQTLCRTLGDEMAEAIRDRMADETDRSARRTYFDALVAMWPASRPVVEAMAEDENRFLARNGVAILGTVGGERAAELVVQVLRATTDPLVRREGLHAMARLRVEDAGALVLKALEDEDEKVRLAAVDAAGELRLERAVRALSAMLDSTRDADVVRSIVQALGRIGDPGAVPSLEKRAAPGLLGRAPTEIRMAAYQALAQIGTPHARRLLNRAADDKDPEVKASARALLGLR